MARFRSRQLDTTSVPSTFRYNQWDFRWGGYWYGWSSWLVNGQSKTFTGSLEMTDRKTPGYFVAVKRGGLIPVSPMSREKTEYILTPGGGSLVTDYDVGGVKQRLKMEVSGYFWKSGSELPSLPELDVPDIKLSLQRALARAQTDAWDQLTFVAEFRKTLEMLVGVRSRADSLYGRFADILASKSKRTTNAVSYAMLMSEVWLEMRYGWRPLYHDIIEINKAIKRMQSALEEPLCRAYDTEHTSGPSSNYQLNGQPAIENWTGWIGGMSCSARHTSSVEYKIHSSVGVRVTTRTATMADPLVTAWEMVPWSFVLDWFVSVGDIISAFSPFATGRLEYSCVSVETVQSAKSSNRMVAGPPFTVLEDDMTNCSLEMRRTTYTRREESPTVTLGAQVNLDVFKIADLVALWLSKNSRITKRILRHF